MGSRIVGIRFFHVISGGGGGAVVWGVTLRRWARGGRSSPMYRRWVAKRSVGDYIEPPNFWNMEEEGS